MPITFDDLFTACPKCDGSGEPPATEAGDHPAPPAATSATGWAAR